MAAEPLPHFDARAQPAGNPIVHEAAHFDGGPHIAEPGQIGVVADVAAKLDLHHRARLEASRLEDREADAVARRMKAMRRPGGPHVEQRDRDERVVVVALEARDDAHLRAQFDGPAIRGGNCGDEVGRKGAGRRQAGSQKQARKRAAYAPHQIALPCTTV